MPSVQKKNLTTVNFSYVLCNSLLSYFFSLR